MKKILVPTDFSPNAARAIDYAVKIARQNQATIFVIHACDELFPFTEENMMTNSKYNHKVMDDAFENLEIIQKSIEETEKISVNIQLYSGTVIDTIPVSAQELEADLIIMGTMGITGIKDKIFGSNTASVISNSTVPVLAIPLEYDWDAPSKILLAINHFDEVTDILHPVFDLAKVLNAEVKLAVFTDEDNASASDFLIDAKEIQLAEEKLRGKYRGLVINAEHLSGRNFEDSINEYIDSNNIDLLAMTTHKRTLLGNIFNRSLTRKMSYHSKIPILAIPVK